MLIKAKVNFIVWCSNFMQKRCAGCRGMQADTEAELPNWRVETNAG